MKRAVLRTESPSSPHGPLLPETSERTKSKPTQYRDNIFEGAAVTALCRASQAFQGAASATKGRPDLPPTVFAAPEGLNLFLKSRLATLCTLIHCLRMFLCTGHYVRFSTKKMSCLHVVLFSGLTMV